MGILFDLCGVLWEIRIQPFRLLGQLVNRDLTNYQGEVLSIGLGLSWIVRLSSNMCLSSECEFLLHVVKRLLLISIDIRFFLFFRLVI